MNEDNQNIPNPPSTFELPQENKRDVTINPHNQFNSEYNSNNAVNASKDFSTKGGTAITLGLSIIGVFLTIGIIRVIWIIYKFFEDLSSF